MRQIGPILQHVFELLQGTKKIVEFSTQKQVSCSVVEPTQLKKYARQIGNHFPKFQGENKNKNIRNSLTTFPRFANSTGW